MSAVWPAPAAPSESSPAVRTADAIQSMLAGAAIAVGVFVVLWPIAPAAIWGLPMGLIFAVVGVLPAVLIAGVDALLVGLPLVALARRLLRGTDSTAAAALVHAVAGLLTASVPVLIGWALIGPEPIWLTVVIDPILVTDYLVCAVVATLTAWAATRTRSTR
jgi:hypothetical protein